METRFFEQARGRPAYDVVGDGPLVVCVPGLGDLRSEYRFLVPALVAAGRRVATLDVRGHGASSTGFDEHRASAIGADVLALTRTLGATSVSIVGTSMTAAEAVWAAAEAPSLVRSVVLIGPFVRDLPVAWFQRAMLSSTKADCEARLASVRAPALVVMGTRDPDFPDPSAEPARIAEELHAEVLLVDGAGHYPHAEKPEVAGPAIAGFLRDHA